MVAKQLISREIPALALHQTGKEAFQLLQNWHVQHLPVADDGRLVGIISEEDIFNHELVVPLVEYDFSPLRRFSVSENAHLFEVMRVMGENRLTVIPVVDAEENYLGLVSQNDLLRTFAHSTTFAESGGILVLEMPSRDFSLATLSKIAEDEDVKVLGAIVNSGSDADDSVLVTLKFNTDELNRVAASYERHEYEIRESHGGSSLAHQDTLRERYDALMAYLNV